MHLVTASPLILFNPLSDFAFFVDNLGRKTGAAELRDESFGLKVGPVMHRRTVQFQWFVAGTNVKRDMFRDIRSCIKRRLLTRLHAILVAYCSSESHLRLNSVVLLFVYLDLLYFEFIIYENGMECHLKNR
jgi:hypothetical protein